MRFQKADAEHLRKFSMDKSENNTLEIIPVDYIRPNPYQPRRVFSEESLDELAHSIKQYGLLQPITVRKLSRDYYEIIAGERRWRAVCKAGFTHIKAVIQPAIDEDSAVLALIENLEREDLHFFEEAEGYQSLMKEHGLTQEELARRLGKNQSTVANKMRILKLPSSVKELISTYKLSERHARALLRLHNEEAQLKLVKDIKQRNLSVKLTEDLVEKTLAKLYGEVPPESGGQHIVCIMRDYRIYLNTIKKALSRIKKSGVKVSYQACESKDRVSIIIELAK
ncbi:MAG: nucleoid occlusion protein [Eubacteriales bacterium]|nr:nucleoid occlusion protein [Eubacteriales bacterium]